MSIDQEDSKELRFIFVRYIQNKERIDIIKDQIKKLKLLEEDLDDDIECIMNEIGNLNEIKTKSMNIRIEVCNPLYLLICIRTELLSIII